VKTQDGIEIEISLREGNSREEAGREMLMSVLSGHDLKPWIYTREVVISSEGLPHSHPIMTLTTESEYFEDPIRQLSTFVHEQMHWFEESEEYEEAVDRAIEDLEERFPDAPGESGRERYSEYLHLVVGWLTLDAMTELVGEEKARQIQATADHYRWVYKTILKNTEEIGTIVAKHDLAITPEKGLMVETSE
jgi:hypothetical protein